MAQVINDGGVGVLTEIITQINKLQTDIAAFTTALNAHVHTPAMTNTIAVGQQAAVTASKVTLKY